MHPLEDAPQFIEGRTSHAFKAILIIRDNANEWCIDSNKIAVCGFSAGGHLASCLATMWNKSDFANLLNSKPEYIRPNAVILSYPAIIMPHPISTFNTGVPEQAIEEFKSNFEDE
ncbi:MAG: alpha/beta hydrolase fold domain-containing protein, partial [Synergistales bacterium]|nr:alpha/beta hydrolase fold domain-containing protein [Synergistales bacterium]